MFTIIKMQARSILRNPASFFIVVFPLILVPVLTSVAVYGFENGLLQTFTNAAEAEAAFDSVLAVVLSSVIAITILAAINNSFGSNFMELKKSIIIKRLGSTQVTKTSAMLGFLLWAVILATVQVLYTIFLFWIVDISGLLTVSTDTITANGTFFGSNIDWLSVIYGLIMLMLVSFAMTFFFMSVATNTETYQIMAFFYFFLVMYFGGLIFTANVQWMNIVSLFLPHTYVAGFLNGAFTDGHYIISDLNEGMPINVWDMTNYSDEYILNGVSSLNVIMPIVFTGAFGYIGIKNFRWDS